MRAVGLGFQALGAVTGDADLERAGSLVGVAGDQAHDALTHNRGDVERGVGELATSLVAGIFDSLLTPPED